MSDREIDIAVVGGGIVGLTTAAALQGAGRAVRLFERNEPGRGCSFGNAGLIQTSLVFPMASVGAIIGAPMMMIDPFGPLAIRPRHLPRLAPWFARFALNTLPARRRRSIDALVSINRHALPAWRKLLNECGAMDLLVDRPTLEVVRHERAIAALRNEAQALQIEGVETDFLDANAVAAIEPALAGRVAAALLHRDTAHVVDPGRVSDAIAARFRAGGGRIERAAVAHVEPTPGGCRITTDQGEKEARQTVIAAGLWSKALIEPLGLAVPVEAERGYHLMLEGQFPPLSHPLSFLEESFIATPMAGGLRLAGTAEFASADAPPDWRRADRLFNLASRYLLGLSRDGARRWMGRRPSFPDSLPAIGRLRSSPQILYCFGHSHLGLTQAAISGECIAAVANGRSPPLAVQPFDLERFAGKFFSPTIRAAGRGP